MGIPSALLADPDFNERPIRLSIHGVREMNPGLFRKLKRTRDRDEAARIFEDYMDVLFGLDDEQRLGSGPDGRRRYRASYRRLLEGWAFDSNGPEGAVLKGWVESRFGLFPTYHKRPIERFSSPAWVSYVEEKMASRFHNNAIQMQLDLLYEFAQWSLDRAAGRGERHRILYRGVEGFEENEILERYEKGRALVLLNNLVSFTADRRVAEQFGGWILTARVPSAKILFFRELLPHHALRSEEEHLVIGGAFRVEIGRP
ncbi:NAD(+)--dinitrogen-reductase ADP-D-ribosyltransferase [Methylacidimicrobium cyclopophantes]|uniref:NAD(+)--dinitrogen-reductase ADP-D-ribosyltransferase n=1 Tax=Methylacidimicrobium cyclopophantes TaxID=1041766 RepID=A0A5E6MKJ6_9BACT|nr:NAD(+)--dinitrogen-reductase ADP-D-ribosyltransferase [Methylacidimicrobium cyclopophantes]VVM06023.1 NAD(+)--dinitrogen-reductase ADP-D-ribosyltransferase [Methylacidimicrobium cyclopophantes]